MEKDIETKGQGDVPQDVNFRAIAEGTSDLVYQHDQLERGLKSRHIQFLALGGA
jgi:amino acid transporter